MATTKKSLNEQISDVMNAKGSRASKRIDLIKLGLTASDVQVLLSTLPATRTAKGYNVNNLTFGVEIECYNVVRQQLIDAVAHKSVAIHSEGYNHADNKSYYKIVSDGSIQGVNGQEVVSPILKGKKGENSLKEVCDALNEVGAKVNRSTGLHVHFGARDISDTHYINIFVNYQLCEKAIDSFMPESRRANNNRYCTSLLRYDFSQCFNKYSVYDMIGSRYTKVNADAYTRHKTIEFRQHSGTTDFTKIAQWVNILRKLIEFSFDKRLNQPINDIESLPFLTKREKQ